jgi:hypothetical protein
MVNAVAHFGTSKVAWIISVHGILLTFIGKHVLGSFTFDPGNLLTLNWKLLGLSLGNDRTNGDALSGIYEY